MWAVVMGLCINCRKLIAFNPNSVPSLMVNNRREPLCRQCAERWNELHPEAARPIKDDAYEAIPEEELKFHE